MKGPALRAREAAAYCGIAYQTLMNLRSLGRGPTAQVHGRLVVFHEDDLDEWKRQYFTNEPAPAAARDPQKGSHDATTSDPVDDSDARAQAHSSDEFVSRINDAAVTVSIVPDEVGIDDIKFTVELGLSISITPLGTRWRRSGTGPTGDDGQQDVPVEHAARRD